MNSNLESGWAVAEEPQQQKAEGGRADLPAAPQLRPPALPAAQVSEQRCGNAKTQLGQVPWGSGRTQEDCGALMLASKPRLGTCWIPGEKGHGALLRSPHWSHSGPHPGN